MITFEGSEEAMIAESILKKKGFHVNFTIPPKGCGLAIEVDLNDKVFSDQLLIDHNIKYLKIVETSNVKR